MRSATFSSRLALLAAGALCGIDAGAIGPLLPAMREASGAGAATGSLLVSLYVAGQLAGIAASGVTARRAGSGAVFRANAALAAAGSLVALLTSDLQWLLLARLLQGLGQGALLPMAAAIVAASFPPEHQGRWIGALSLAYGVAFLAAIVATPSVIRLTWHAPFAVSLVLAVTASVLVSTPRAAAVPAARPPRLGRTLRPLLLVALGTGVGQAAVVYLPTLSILRLGIDATETGRLMLPLVVCGVGATIAITLWMDRLGAHVLLVGGAAATLVAIAICAWAPASQALFMAGSALLGAGITALCGGPLRYAAMRAVAPGAQSIAQASVALVTNVGVLAGSLLIGAVAAAHGDERTALQTALAAACAIMAATFLPLARKHAARATWDGDCTQAPRSP